MSTGKSIRSDSSASTLTKEPISPIPSSVEALPSIEEKWKKMDAPSSSSKINNKTNGDAVPVNGEPKTATQSVQRRTMPGRTRSASFQKGAAVLRALARAPEDEIDDSGYEDEGKEGNLEKMPGPSLPNGASSHSPDQHGLTEEAKQTGRENREGLRKRKDDKQVAKIVGAFRSNSEEMIKREKKKAKSWEIPRKIFHSSIGFIVLYLYVSKTDLTIIVHNLSYFLGVVVTADVLRLNIPSFEWLYEKVLGFLMRESEKEKVNGVVWYLIGVLFCLSLLPEDIACVSIMILSWADTAASVFGRLFGKYTPPLPSPPFATRKSLAGTIAASSIAGLTATLFWATPIAQIGKRRLLASEGKNAIPLPLLCIGSGIVGGVAEALELGGVDDNLSLPILCALGIKAVVWTWNYIFP